PFSNFLSGNPTGNSKPGPGPERRIERTSDQKNDHMTLSPEQRAACEQAGVEEVRRKMNHAGPGDGAAVPGLGDGLITVKAAACWIREQERHEIIALKPGLWGFSIDLRAAFRRAQKWRRSR